MDDLKFNREFSAAIVANSNSKILLKADKAACWCFSLDNENYSLGTYGTDREALAAGQAEAKERINDRKNIKFIYVAQSVEQLNSSFFPDGGDIIEHMENQADAVGGDYTNNYPDVTDEAVDELTVELHALLEKWCKKHEVAPTFYSVSEPNCYDVNTLQLVVA